MIVAATADAIVDASYWTGEHDEAGRPVRPLLDSSESEGFFRTLNQINRLPETTDR